MEEKRFSTNAFLTLVTNKLFTDIGMVDDSENILKEAMDIISYMYEDIPDKLTKNIDINNTCKNLLIGSVDPIIIEIAHETNQNNYNKNKVILNKLLGETVPVKKITESHIEKMNQYKQKRKTN